MAILLCTFLTVTLASVSVANADTIVERSCVQAAKAVKLQARTDFICFDGIANVSATIEGKKKTFVVNEASHEYRETTGKSEHERKSLVSEVKGDDQALIKYGTYVDTPYRGRAEYPAAYGQSGGGTDWSTSMFLREIISLQSNNHWFEYYWTQNDNRLVAFSAVIQLKRYIYWPGTDVVADTVPTGNSVFATNDKKSTYLQTEYSDRQFFYFNMTNFKVNDLEAGVVFDLHGDAPGPLFECKPASGCIYPNGEEAKP
ncbi:hypothetical protein [Amycolatopsis sp. lyj-108]|uniref:hypothetical protein n=1 Tax=Amycolatopsis sp. lyj-108 TaxID=2789286 RepID=UPI00397CD9C0